MVPDDLEPTTAREIAAELSSEENPVVHYGITGENVPSDSSDAPTQEEKVDE